MAFKKIEIVPTLDSVLGQDMFKNKIAEIQEKRNSTQWWFENWQEKPLSFHEFCTSDDHLKFETISDRQLDLCYKILYGCPFVDFEKKRDLMALKGQDIYWIWSNQQYSMLIWLSGKGAGKDFISSLMMAYISYIFLIAKEPFKKLGVSGLSHIECINVSYDRDAAKKSFFAYLKNTMTGWKWLKRNYNIDLSGDSFNKIVDRKVSKVVITSDAVMFPNGVNLYSEDSSNESSEVYNTLFYFLSEISAFKDNWESRNGDKILRTLRGGVASRFGTAGRGIVASFPRYTNDIIWRLYKWGLTQLHVACEYGATWEFKKMAYEGHPTFPFEYEYFDFSDKLVKKIFNIPIDFKQDFDSDPVDAARKFLAAPPIAERPFLDPKLMAGFDNIVEQTLQPIMFFEEKITDIGGTNYIQKVFKGVNPIQKTAQYVIGIDIGYKECSAGVAVVHKEDDMYFIDLIERWTPSKEKNIIVDIDDVEQAITKILENVKHVVGVFADRWNSAGLLIRVKKKGIYANEFDIDYEDFDIFRSLIVSKHIKSVPNAQFIQEMRELQDFQGTKVKKGEHQTKDLVDAVMCALKFFFERDKKANTSLPTNMKMRGTFITGNIGSYDKNMWEKIRGGGAIKPLNPPKLEDFG